MMKRHSMASSVIILITLIGGLVLSGGAAVAADASTAQEAQFVAPIMVVNTSFLNVRTGPGIAYGILTVVPGGTELPVLARASDNVWFQVSSAAGVGWVNSQFTVPRGSFAAVPTISLAEIPPPEAAVPSVGLAAGAGGGSAPADVTAGPHLVVNTSFLNVRSGPGAHFTIVATVPGGTELAVTAITSDGVWFRVMGDFGEGWVNGQFIAFRGTRGAVPVISFAEAAAGGTPDIAALFRAVVVVNTSFLNVRSGPGAHFAVVETLPGGAELQATGLSSDRVWFRVEGDFGEGWVNNQFTVFRGNINAVPIIDLADATVDAVIAAPPAPAAAAATTFDARVVVNTSFLNIRSGPGAHFAAVATVPGGTVLPVLALASDRVWFLVGGDFGEGWVNNQFTLFRGNINAVPIIDV